MVHSPRSSSKTGLVAFGVLTVALLLICANAFTALNGIERKQRRTPIKNGVTPSVVVRSQFPESPVGWQQVVQVEGGSFGLFIDLDNPKGLPVKIENYDLAEDGSKTLNSRRIEQGADVSYGCYQQDLVVASMMCRKGDPESSVYRVATISGLGDLKFSGLTVPGKHVAIAVESNAQGSTLPFISLEVSDSEDKPVEVAYRGVDGIESHVYYGNSTPDLAVKLRTQGDQLNKITLYSCP